MLALRLSRAAPRLRVALKPAPALLRRAARLHTTPLRAAAVGPAVGAAPKHVKPTTTATAAAAAAAHAEPASAATPSARRPTASAGSARKNPRFAVAPASAPAHELLPAAVYEQHVTALYATLTAGLTDMAAVNPGFAVSQSVAGDVLSLLIAAGPDVGTYEFAADRGTQVLTVSSPVSGVYRYVVDAREARFVDASDGHILVELIARELITKCKGSVNF